MTRYLIALLAWRRAFRALTSAKPMTDAWWDAAAAEGTALIELGDAECAAGLCGHDPRVIVTV